jgi:hypothetical protein
VQWFKLVILATWEAEVGRITVWGQSGQKVHKTPFQPVIPTMANIKQEDSGPKQKERDSLQNTRAAGRVAQVVERLRW